MMPLCVQNYRICDTKQVRADRLSWGRSLAVTASMAGKTLTNRHLAIRIWRGLSRPAPLPSDRQHVAVIAPCLVESYFIIALRRRHSGCLHRMCPPHRRQSPLLSQSRQSFDQPSLSAMLLPDRAQSAKEVIDRALLLGDRLEIEEQERRLVVASRFRDRCRPPPPSRRLRRGAGLRPVGLDEPCRPFPPEVSVRPRLSRLRLAPGPGQAHGLARGVRRQSGRSQAARWRPPNFPSPGRAAHRHMWIAIV